MAVGLIEEAETLIKENEALLPIGKVDHSSSKFEYYLNMNEEELDEMDKGDCCAAQYSLTQYAITVNKSLNWIQSKLKINTLIFQRELMTVYHSYNEFLGKDLIIASAVNEYGHLKDMQDEILKLDALVGSMQGLVGQIDRLLMILRDLSFSKGKS